MRGKSVLGVVWGLFAFKLQQFEYIISSFRENIHIEKPEKIEKKIGVCILFFSETEIFKILKSCFDVVNTDV